MWRSVAGLSSAVVIILAIALALTFQMQPPASREWQSFSIGPASGDWTTINTSQLRSDGVTLMTLIAVAYEIPSVRILGPASASQTRYSVTAVAPREAPQQFRQLLRQELEGRFRLRTHIEDRPFDVLVLTGKVPHLERAAGGPAGTTIHPWDAQLKSAGMDRLAAALQSILGKPVIDETGIQGTYDIELTWGENRPVSVAAFLESHFGLHLSAARRDMPALVVDHLQPDPVLSVFSGIERLTRHAPRGFRRHISGVLSIH